jgi:glutamyl-tRNA synthetase
LEKGVAYKDERALRFKFPKEGETSWTDLVGNKKINFDNSTQEDFVILKSDGFPTYNFANVIDDHLMEISHVIRGNEFISSTPKHLMIYQAFGWEPPQFAHLPVLLGADRSKLSKRHGAKSALDFKKEGYLKEAVLNFLALLGWSFPGGKEVFTLEEMIKVFDFKDFNPSSAYFDEVKLDWLNGEYIRKMSDQELTEKLEEFLVDHPDKSRIATLVPLVKERIKKLSDFILLTNFFFYPPEYDLEPFKKLKMGEDKDKVKEALSQVIKRMEGMSKPWKKEEFEESFKKLAEELGATNFDIFQLIRLGVSGQLVTPPLFESLEILGEEESLKRLKKMAELYPSFPDIDKDLKIETAG